MKYFTLIITGHKSNYCNHSIIIYYWYGDGAPMTFVIWSARDTAVLFSLAWIQVTSSSAMNIRNLLKLYTYYNLLYRRWRVGTRVLFVTEPRTWKSDGIRSNAHRWIWYIAYSSIECNETFRLAHEIVIRNAICQRSVNFLFRKLWQTLHTIHCRRHATPPDKRTRRRLQMDIDERGRRQSVAVCRTVDWTKKLPK